MHHGRLPREGLEVSEPARGKGRSPRIAPTPPEWESQMARNGKGVPTKEAGNVAITLTHDPAWKGAIAHDIVTDECVVIRYPTSVTAIPRAVAEGALFAPPPPGAVRDQHVDYIALWLRHRWQQTWTPEAVRRGIEYAARSNPIDPIRDYLEGCVAEWDRRPRLDTWLTAYFGADDTPIVRRVGRMWMISAVARAMAPGCKVDYVLVLEGNQGVGKNRALELLFQDRWYLPEVPDLRDKDAMHALVGTWCACIDELRAIRAVDVEKVKSFLTRRIDRYRPPYGRSLVSAPRRAVFAATTNAGQYLTDESGNRRYWSVTCGRVDHDAIARDRNALWAEALDAYRKGEKWWPTEGDRADLETMQALREQVDEWEADIAKHVENRDWCTAGDCLSALGVEKKDWSTASQHRVWRALTRLGWKAVQARIEGRPRRHWVAPEGSE